MKPRAALGLATGALAAALAAAAAVKAHVPGDVPEDHEDNTYGLPEGAPIRKKLRRYFRDQLKRVVGSIGKIGAPVPAHFPKMADYTDSMASAFTPILGAYWDKAGRGLQGRLGLDPDGWRVTDPHIHEAIAEQSLKFCRATNATTDLGLAEAREAVRDQLARGLIREGESVAQLTARIKTVFARATDERARMIAQTEASRAVHAASEMSAIASGVVSAKKILVSANSCPLCVRVAEEAGAVALGQAFARVGRDPDYSSVRMPPIHPHCRCSVAYVPIGEGPDVPAFVPGKDLPARVEGPASAPAPDPDGPSITRQQALDRAVELGKKHGVEVVLDGYDFLIKHSGDTPEQARQTFAFFSGRDEKIHVVTENPFWDDVAGEMKRRHATGFLGTDHVDHVITHEIGHALHFKHSPSGFVRESLDPEVKPHVAKEVSRYGASSADEFVAEVYAGTTLGTVYSPEVMALYAHYNGPPIGDSPQQGSLWGRLFGKKGK